MACKESAPKYKENILKYENGTTKRKFYTDKDGQIQDTMWDYYSSGELSKIRLFLNNKQTGRNTYYLKEGPLYEVQNYIDGKMEGVDSVFYPSGKLKLLAEFKNGMKNGYFKVFREDGSLEKYHEYRNDSLIIMRDSLGIETK